jgi:hypothetical protein
MRAVERRHVTRFSSSPPGGFVNFSLACFTCWEIRYKWQLRRASSLRKA